MPDPHATGSRADGWRNVGLAPSNFGDEPKSWWQWKRPERHATGSSPTKISRPLAQCILSLKRPGDMPLGALHALQDAIREMEKRGD